MRLPQRHALLGGIALLVCGAALLELALIRLYTALFGPHIALLALSLPLLGTALGGAFLYVFPGVIRRPALHRRLARVAAYAGGTAAAAVIVALHAFPIDSFARRKLLLLGGLHLAATLPFLLVAIAVVASIQSARSGRSGSASPADPASEPLPRPASCCAAYLAAAAAGTLAGAFAIRMGAPRLVLSAAVAMALSAFVLWLGAPILEPGAPRGGGSTVATFVLGTAVLLLGDLGAPWIKLPGLRWAAMAPVQLQVWSERALITVDRPRGGSAWMRRDGTAAVPILSRKATPPIQPDDMAYALNRKKGPVLVIGPGGGREIRLALKTGQKEVHALEIDPAVVQRVMRGRYAKHTGDLYDQPEVLVTVGDGRRYARQSREPFRLIVLPQPDTGAASTSGALALVSTPLHTVEAVRDLLARLVPEGTLVITRWDFETDRLLALAVAALRASGAAEAKGHLFACGGARMTALLIKQTPLQKREINALRRHCRKNRHVEILAPDRAAPAAREALLAGAPIPGELAPPTDERPFFAEALPLRRLPVVFRNFKDLQANHTALLAAAGALAFGFLLWVLLFLGGVLRQPGGTDAAGPRPARGVRAGLLLLFSSLGACLVLVVMGVARPLESLLGDVRFVFPSLLTAFLLAAAAGGLLTARVPAVLVGRAAAARAGILVVLTTLSAIALGQLLAFGLGLSLAARLVLAALAMVLLGLLLGAQLPLGSRVVVARHRSLLPLCWAVFGAAGVAATAAGTSLVAEGGYSAALLAAGLAQLLVALVLSLPSRGES